MLLSIIRAAAGKWEELSVVGTKEVYARSQGEVDEKVHRIVVADISHPEAKVI